VSWTDSEGVERGGACNQCGEPVEADHHAFCRDCFAAQQGWADSRTDSDALRWQHEERSRVVTVQLLARIDRLERRVAELERRQEREAA
jgi:hypothetical protein